MNQNEGRRRKIRLNGVVVRIDDSDVDGSNSGCRWFLWFLEIKTKQLETREFFHWT